MFFLIVFSSFRPYIMEESDGDLENRPTTPLKPVISVPMPVLPQDGEVEIYSYRNAFTLTFFQVFVGPGGKKDAQKIGLGLSKLSSKRKDDIQMARKYAMDISIKQILLRQQKQQQENVSRNVFSHILITLISATKAANVCSSPLHHVENLCWFHFVRDKRRHASQSFRPVRSH